MHHLSMRHLKRFCDKHGLDYQEIDDTLTYWENKEHLKSLAPPLTIEDQIKEWGPYLRAMRDEELRHMREHILSHYITCIIDGSNVSEDVGDPLPPRFSLAAYSRRGKC